MEWINSLWTTLSDIDVFGDFSLSTVIIGLILISGFTFVVKGNKS